ncbi:SAV_915 family protein [Mycetocola saprophilus]|uniref:SAV_915 family protein n=1 Tax=Mycetocola saprophilus TaxID=76636 RepID=UPI001FE13D4C|nr:SAV_915 family protein [Mycetocola saprophilus]
MSGQRIGEGLLRGRRSPYEAVNGVPVQRDTIIPPMLYLPIRIDELGRQFVEVRPHGDGKRALLAFTALDRLASQCGPEQPWIVVQTDRLGEIKEAFPFDVVSFDPAIGAHLRAEGKLR